jgi:hypothetical protein
VLLEKKPIAGVSVNFIPQQGTSGLGAYAVTDESGKFQLTHYSHAEGISPGTYAVTFSKLACPDGSPIPPDAVAADVGAVETLPTEVTVVDPEGNHPYMATITGPQSDLSFELKARKRR